MIYAPFTLGNVGHFGLAVRDASASADWYVTYLGLQEQFRFDKGVAVGNNCVTIALFNG
ncbi:MAG: VOC family protein, partial [Candidatus Eremiobacteraeota bacterium]|nr:VOC family protein [Candidatus Eremiobacteraeota bacterium]